MFQPGALDAVEDQVLSVTRAPAPLFVTDMNGGRRFQVGEFPFSLLAGERLKLGQPASGFRSYRAFRGGLSLPQVFFSRSIDLLS